MKEQGCAAIVAVDPGSHTFEGTYDSPHGAGRKRHVAGESALECLSSQDACQESHSGTGITAVDGLVRRNEPQSFSMDHQLCWTMVIAGEVVTIDAKALHCPQGVQAILAGEVIANMTGAIREACDNGGAMGNALVSGHPPGVIP